MAYFDHNATTPLAPVASEAWLRIQKDLWQNPASPYRAGARAALQLEAVRERLGDWLGVSAERMIFTSGATEGANAVASYWASHLPAGKRVLVSAVEHPCVLASVARYLSGRYDVLPVGASGAVDISEVERLLKTKNYAAVVVMAANNETGVLQPWSEISQLCGTYGAEYLCDASQWLGKIAGATLGTADWILGTGHKWGGPKGTGLLVRAGAAGDFGFLAGGAQQRGHRSGTEDVAGVVAMEAALLEAEQRWVCFESAREAARKRHEQQLLAAVPGARIVAAHGERLWNTVLAIMPHAENTRWVLKLDKLGHQVSTGSACASGKEQPSHVLAAMGHAADEIRRSVRVSSGWSTTEEDWQALLESFSKVAAELRG